MFLRKLITSHLLAHRVRGVLTITAMALAVSLVVAVTSGYATVEAAAYRYLNLFLGTTDAEITRLNDPRGGVSESLIDEFERDPDVRSVLGRLELESAVLDRQGKPVAGRPASLVGIRRPQDAQVETQQLVAGKWFNESEGNVAVVDQVAAQKLEVQVGQTFFIPAPDRQLELTLVGIVHKPGILASHLQTIYLPLETLQQFAMSDRPQQVSRLMIDLHGDADAAAFAARWQERLKQIDPLLRLKLTAERRTQLEQDLLGLELLSYLGGAVSMLAAMFIVFSALSMGVTERQRTLAMLRAVGMLRRHVGAMVVVEGLLLAALGALLGVPLGWLWLMVLVSIPQFEAILAGGAAMSWGGIAFGVLGPLAAALVASFLPAWSAMRVSPLEAMSPLGAPPSARVPIICAAIGLLLVSIDPLLLFAPLEEWLGISSILARSISFYGHFVLGVPGVMIGFFLLAPLFVWVIEWTAGPVVAAMHGLNFKLLRQQLSGGIWRAAGTCAALMVGLAILIVTQTQGNSVLNSWRLPNKFPDLFIVAPPLGPLTPAQQQTLERVPGIKQGELMPIAIASPEFANPLFAMVGALVMPNATMFFGVDPDKAFDMMDLEFREGSAQEAKEMLRRGRHVIVTEEFRQLKKLGVGDTIALKTPLHGNVEYTIAGVVWSPGMDVINSVFDMGSQFDQRTAGSLFGTLEDARRDFGVEEIYLFAANLEHFVDKELLLNDIHERLGKMGMKVGDVRQIKYEIQKGFGNLLLLVSTVGFAAMAVASLGVTNTIMASIRSRRWQLGILRSIGVTRSQLLRLVLAEALLLGLVGCGLGLAAGLEMSINANALSRVVLGFHPPIDIPWGIIWVGVGVVMLISLLASIWPALTVSRTEPLALLQAGRAAT